MSDVSMIWGDTYDYCGRMTGDCTASISCLELLVNLVLPKSWAGTDELANELGDVIDRIHLPGQVMLLEKALEGGIPLRRAVESQRGLVQIHFHRACILQGFKAAGPFALHGRWSGLG